VASASVDTAALSPAGVLTTGTEIGMATQKVAGLDAAQLDKLRDALASGGRPRVQLPAAQFGAGTTGTVVRIGDPAADGDDYVIVQVKVAGVSDELGFAPDELATPTRKRAAKQLPDPAPAPAPRAPAPRAAKPAKSAPAKALPTEAVPAKSVPAKSVPTKAVPTKAVPTKAAPTKAAPTKPAPAAQVRRPARSGRGSAPAVTITIASEGSSWTLSAQRGPRTLLRRTPVMPGIVAAISGLLDQPELEGAVADVNDASRAEAEAQAERLRAELAQVEAVLSSHRRP
jgi:hypothetical protein